jgi:xanthine dehydrogenase YagS FAD-binding subunit
MRPWRLLEAEQRLSGLRPEAPEVLAAIDAAMAAARPAAQSAYKVKIARGAARRALVTAAGVAG